MAGVRWLTVDPRAIKGWYGNNMFTRLRIAHDGRRELSGHDHIKCFNRISLSYHMFTPNV